MRADFAEQADDPVRFVVLADQVEPGGSLIDVRRLEEPVSTLLTSWVMVVANDPAC